jgi:hypothetical protein
VALVAAKVVLAEVMQRSPHKEQTTALKQTKLRLPAIKVENKKPQLKIKTARVKQPKMARLQWVVRHLAVRVGKAGQMGQVAQAAETANSVNV